MASVKKRKWKHNGEEKTAYVVRYVDDKGVRRSKQFDKFKTADAYRRKVEAEMDAGVHVASVDAVTVGQCCRNFLESAELRLERGQIGRSRMEIYRVAIRRYIEPTLGTKVFATLKWSDLDDWQNSMTKLSTRSIESMTTVFKMIEEHALKRGHIKRTIVREFKRDAGSAKVEPIRTFDAEMAAKLIRAAAERPKLCRRRVRDMTECCFHVAAFCGLRIGEIMGLTLPNIDFERRVIRVRHSLTNWDVLKSPKTKSGIRDVPMPDHIAGLLKAWISSHFVANERHLVFRSPTGLRIGPGNWRDHYWWPLLKAAGLWDEGGDQLHFHACRHFAASWMIEHGLALPDVASLMGHSKFDMTLQVYAHPIVGGHRRHDAFTRMSGSLMAAAQAPVASAANRLLSAPQN